MRAGKAWEHSNKTMLFLPPHNEVSLSSPMTLHFHLLFYYIFNPLSFLYETSDADPTLKLQIAREYIITLLLY
jgi:hypothetical protein